jgi:hypothetical protein
MSYRRLFTVLGTAAASVLLAAPIAQAAPTRPDDRSLPRGAAVAMPDLIERSIDRQARMTSAPDLVDRAVARLRGHEVRAAAPASSPGTGFDWSAAGIGASTASVLLLLAASVLAATRRYRIRSVSPS